MIAYGADGAEDESIKTEPPVHSKRLHVKRRSRNLRV
jgi:hypothetical protein